jgi:hypothetical protein
VRDTETVARYEESSELRLAVRDDGTFLVWHDSVRKAEALRGARPASAPLWPEDTLRYFVRLSRWGEFLTIEPDCDPAVPACHDAVPSALPQELRHVVPRLPVWWPPKGHEWEDTLAFDDLPRPRGWRGSVVTVYRAPRDTVAGGRAYWIVTWRSVRRSSHEADGGAMIAEAPVGESGVVYVDKGLLIPAYAEWRGSVPPRPELRAAGAARTVFRGRAVLMGSRFDSLPFAEEAR